MCIRDRPKDIRLINSHYDDLYRIPDGGVIQVDYPDGRSFTARVEHLDDYHFDMGGLGNVFHICQFAEVMERNHADFYPEIQTQDEQAAWEPVSYTHLVQGKLKETFKKQYKLTTWVEVQIRYMTVWVISPLGIPVPTQVPYELSLIHISSTHQ